MLHRMISDVKWPKSHNTRTLCNYYVHDVINTKKLGKMDLPLVVKWMNPYFRFYTCVTMYNNEQTVTVFLWLTIILQYKYW